MSQAHKGSRLLLSGNIVPVDFSSAHFNYINDANGIQYGDMIYPVSGSIYTIRPYEGKFGSAVAVEEATTNIVANPNGGASNYGSGNVTDIVVVGGQFDGWRKVTINTVNTTNNFLCYMDGFTIVSGNTNPYSYSIDFYSPRGNIYPRMDGTWGVGSAINTGGYRWEYNNYSRASGSVGGVVHWYPYNSGGVVAGDFFYWRNKQVEQKVFSTSYTSSSRTAGSLQYAISPNASQGSISFWINVTSQLKDTANYRAVIAVRNSNNYDDGLTLFHDNGAANFRLKCVGDTGTITNIYISDSLVPNGWRYFTIKWISGSRLSLYVDGVEVGFSSSPSLATGYKTAFYVGNEEGNTQMNTMLCDLVINNYAISDEEINAMYISNRALYNPYDYRSYAY